MSGERLGGGERVKDSDIPSSPWASFLYPDVQPDKDLADSSRGLADLQREVSFSTRVPYYSGVDSRGETWEEKNDRAKKSHPKYVEYIDRLNNYNDLWQEKLAGFLSNMRGLSPTGQLGYLSDVIEAQNGILNFDSNVLSKIASDSANFSPLVRLMAKERAGFDRWGDEDDYRPKNYEQVGYSSIVYPSSMSLGILTQEEENMSKEQVEAELAALNSTDYDYDYDYDDAAMDDNISRYNTLDFALYRLYFLENQEKLHNEFPLLPKESQLVKIASDAAATVVFRRTIDYDDHTIEPQSRFDQISDSDGHVVEMPNADAIISDRELVGCIEILHNNKTLKGLVEKSLGISLVDLPLKSQAFLLKFMTEAGDTRFDSLCGALHKVEPGLRLKLAEGFLAADFGEDFGDALLEIANSPRINGEQLEKMLDEFNTCRASIRKITDLYKGYDGGEFAKEYARAANERLTDALMVFREIARRGEANAKLGWFGEAGFDYASALEALEYEAKSLEIISGTLGDVTAGVKGAFAEKFLHPDEQHGRSMYDFYSPEHGYVLLYTRPEGAGSFEPMLEYGKIRSKYDKNNNNSGVEASVSLIVNPVNPYSLPNPFRPDHRKVKDMSYYDHATMDKVSAIRLDREGRAPDARPDDPNRDPINDVGAISVDLAAINDRADTPSGKIARLFSVGNKLRSEDRARDSVGVRAGGAGGEVDTSLNHNTNWFDQGKYGVADGFSQLVGYVDRLATGWCANMPPQGNEGFTGMMRAVSRRRGAKVRRSA